MAKGAASVDAHRLGLVVAPNGQVLGGGGAPTPGLFALGPLCQGSLWEITAVPEIVRQCDEAAQSIAALEPVRRARGGAILLGPLTPDFGGKDRMVNVTGPEKATKLRIFMGAAGGNPAGVNFRDRHHAGAGGQEADDRCVSWPWLRLAALLALLSLAPLNQRPTQAELPQTICREAVGPTCRGRRSFLRRLKHRCPPPTRR